MIDIPFLRTHADKVVLESVQLNLYVTVCKMLKAELIRIRQRKLQS
jgi:hypothetical protein